MGTVIDYKRTYEKSRGFPVIKWSCTFSINWDTFKVGFRFGLTFVAYLKMQINDFGWQLFHITFLSSVLVFQVVNFEMAYSLHGSEISLINFLVETHKIDVFKT